MPTKLSNLNFFILQDRHSSVSRPLRVRGILWCHGRVALRSFFRGRLPGTLQALSLMAAAQSATAPGQNGERIFENDADFVFAFTLGTSKGVAHSLSGGRVDPVNATLERAMNCGDRLFVVLLAPAKFPTRATNGPSPKANGRNRQVGVAELLRVYINLFKFRFYVPGLLARGIRSKHRTKRAGPRTAELQPARSK